MLKRILAIGLLAICPVLLAQQTLNNAAVIKMVKAGLSDELIMTTIHAQSGTYDVSTDGLIALKAAGVSDKVVSAMVVKAAAEAQPAPAQPAQPEQPKVVPRVTLTVTAQCSKDPDPLGFFSSSFYSKCQQRELDDLRAWIAAELAERQIVIADANESDAVQLAVTLTKSMDKRHGDFGPGTAMFAGTYQITNAANQVLNSGTVTHQGPDKNVADVEKQFAVKIADAMDTQIDAQLAGSSSAGAGGSTTAAATAPGQKPVDIATQAKILGQANYLAILAQAYRSLAVKPPLPDEVRQDEHQAKAALKAHDPNAAIQAYIAALKLAPWWPEGMRELALVFGKLNLPAPANYWMHMYLAFAPDAKDAPKMEEKVNEWVEQIPPQPHPPTQIQVPPGTRGVGVAATDVPSIVALSLGQPNLKGALVLIVYTGSVAETVGLRKGDIIVSYNGTPVSSTRDLAAATSAAKPGTTATLEVQRGQTQIPIKVQF